MSAQRSLMEGLESRVLMSATPAPMLFNPTVRADRLAVRADLLKFQSDIFGNESRLLNDNHAIRRNTAKGDTSLVAPFMTLTADVKAMRTALRIDRLTEASNALIAEATIKLDIVQIIKDRKNAAAEVADHTKLRADRAALQNALIAGLDSRVATRQADETTISNDAAAIVVAAENDPNASPALQTAVGIFSTDRINAINTLTGDLQTIAIARAKLAADLTAAQAT